jgi:hypothetical protein
MRVFFLDLWLDLREKRLAPVALLLLAGIIAVPIVLANDEKTPAPSPQPTTTTAASAAPVIQSDAGAGPVESKLQTFSPRDPFEPTGGSGTTGGSTGTTGATGTTGTSGTSTGTTGSSGGGGGATTGTGPSTDTGTGTGPGTGTNGTGNTTGETKTTLFTYTVDLRFGEGGNVAAFKDVNRLDLIPNADEPKVVFLGVTTTGKTAVFLVDKNIGVDTSGKCRPSADECTFLYLRPDDDRDQALLTDADGTVYHLRLLKIHRVSVSSSNGSTGTGNSGSGRSGNSNRSPAFTGQAKRKDTTPGDTTVPGEDNAPPGEPDKRSSFQQFFADGSSDTGSN